MIKPTVGRVVWFWPATHSAEGNWTPPAEGEPCAAIISKVWSDSCVNLAVFDGDGKSHSKTSVPLVQENEPAPEFGYFCTWMPFQLGQAKKTEELQAQVDGSQST